MQPEVWAFRIGSLGDALVSLPAVHEIRARHPEAKIVLLSNQGRADVVNAGDILRHSGVFDETISYKQGDRLNLIKILIQLRLRRPSHLYYLAPTRSLKQRRRDQFFFGRLAAVPNLPGFESNSQWAGTEFRRVRRESARLLEIVAPGRDVDDVATKRMLEIPPAERLSASEKLQSAGMSVGADRPMIALVPGSKMAAKRWPVERFIEVSEILVDRIPGLQIAVLGSADEHTLAQELCTAAKTGGLFNLAGKTSLMEAAAILEQSVAYLGNDTGTMHLAAAMGIPCVALFSARDLPGKWEPYGKMHRILRVDTACAGCMLEVCDRDLECLTRIGVDRVLEELAAVLPPTISLSPARAAS